MTSSDAPHRATRVVIIGAGFGGLSAAKGLARAHADVTVFDLATGTSHTADKADDPFDSRLVQRIREFSREYEQRLRQALDYIPSVVVTVNVYASSSKNNASVYMNALVMLLAPDV